MRKIVYYVAASLDGFICGPDDDISGFIGEGEGVNKYLEDLKTFDTVIMGRRTYEFGYKFGLQPGQPAYPHMKNYIFSRTLKFGNQHEHVFVQEPDLDFIRELKNQNGTDIYLCGGGEFAGWLLDNDLIDRLTIKLNPLILSKGIKLFGSSNKRKALKPVEREFFNDGLQIVSYSLR